MKLYFQGMSNSPAYYSTLQLLAWGLLFLSLLLCLAGLYGALSAALLLWKHQQDEKELKYGITVPPSLGWKGIFASSLITTILERRRFERRQRVAL